MSFNELLAQVHYLNHPYISGTVTVCLIFLGLFIYFSKRTASNLIFCLMLCDLAVWFFCNTMSMLTYRNINTAFFWFQIGYTVVPFIPVAAYHYYHAKYGKKIGVLLLLYATGLIEALLVWGFDPYRLKISALPNVGIVFHNGPDTPFFWYLFFGMVKWAALYSITAWLFFRVYKQETQPFKRHQLRFTVIVFALFALGAVEWLANFNVPLHIGWIAAISFFMPMGYAITRYRLMDINLFISQGLAGTALFIIFGSMQLCLFKIFEGLMGPTGAILLSLGIVGWVGLFSPLRSMIQHRINRALLKGKYDYQEALREATHAVVSILDLEELLFYLIDIIKSSLNVRTLAFLLGDEAEGNYVLRWGDGIKKDLLGNYEIKNGVVEWIKKKKTVFVKEEQSMVLSHREFEALTKDIERINAEIIVPLFYKGRLEGLLALDHKANKEPYVPSDIVLLEGLASQAMVAIKNAQLYEEAIIDSLTGLFHHKYFMRRIKEEIDKVKRYKYPLGLLMIDLDHFKEINDTYGHQTGDAVLVKVAQIIKNATRRSDIVCRYGGEEFSIILPEPELKNQNINDDTIPQGVLVAAERLRKKVEEETFKTIGGREIKITISVGIAYVPAHSDEFTASDLVEHADKALYHAKENGRNRIEAYNIVRAII